MGDRSLKIALFAPDLAGGGAERILAHLANGMAARGCAVDVVLLDVVGVYLAELSPEVRVVDLRSRRTATGVWPLVRYLRRAQPDVVLSAHAHSSIATLLAKRLARVASCIVPTVQTSHTKAAEHCRGLRDRLVRASLGWSHSWADAIVACSNGVADDFVQVTGLPRDRVRVIYNPIVTPQLKELAKQPVDHPWFAPGQPEVVLGVGRFSAPKDFPTVVNAFALLRKKRNLRLAILGEGAERSSLERLVADLGLTQDVSLPGFAQNPFGYLAKAAVFVFSSLWEGLPTALVEALALGVPIVATDCDCGPREILQGGRYGRLVPVGDVEAMAQALEETLSQPRPEVPEEYVRQFTLDAVVDKYLQLFAEIR